MLRNVGTEQHERLEVLLCFWSSLTQQQIIFTLSWPSQDFTKLRLCPGVGVRGTRAKELPTCFDHISWSFKGVLESRVKGRVETLLDFKRSPRYWQCCQQRLTAYQRRPLHDASLDEASLTCSHMKRTFLLRQNSWKSGPADLFVKGMLSQ